MYEEYYKLSCDPFRLNPRTENCFKHESYTRAQSYILYVVRRSEGIVLITGLAGTGKTTLVRDCISTYKSQNLNFVELSVGKLKGDDLIYLVAHKCGVTVNGAKTVVQLAETEAYLQRVRDAGRRTILVIDEAQSLEDSAIDEVKNLANMEYQGQPLLQIFLLGQNSLKTRLARPEYIQVMHRVIAACELKPMSEQETQRYIEHCMTDCGWTGDPEIQSSIYQTLYAHSGGVPRHINLIFSRLMLRAMVNSNTSLNQGDIDKVLNNLKNEGLVKKKAC